MYSSVVGVDAEELLCASGFWPQKTSAAVFHAAALVTISSRTESDFGCGERNYIRI